MQQRIETIVFCLLLMTAAMPAVVAAEALVLDDDRVSVKLGPEVAAAPEKIKAIKEYRIMERLQEELRNRMADLPRTFKAQIVITKLHLRSGSAVFFAGRATGDDFIYTDITITDKGKQTHHMVFESVNTASSHSQVPPRRVNNMIRKFGTQVSRELRPRRRQ